jgi:hypothetical protein
MMHMQTQTQTQTAAQRGIDCPRRTSATQTPHHVAQQPQQPESLYFLPGPREPPQQEQSTQEQEQEQEPYFQPQPQMQLQMQSRSSSSSSTCLICMRALALHPRERHDYTLPCSHCFHVTCVAVWLEQHQHCPTCGQGVPAMARMMIGRSLKACIGAAAAAAAAAAAPAHVQAHAQAQAQAHAHPNRHIRHARRTTSSLLDTDTTSIFSLADSMVGTDSPQSTASVGPSSAAPRAGGFSRGADPRARHGPHGPHNGPPGRKPSPDGPDGPDSAVGREDAPWLGCLQSVALRQYLVTAGVWIAVVTATFLMMDYVQPL